MPYQRLPTKAANDPLGPGWLNAQRSNVQFLRGMFGQEHLSTGEHNCWEVAQLTTFVTGTTPSPAYGSKILGITNPSTGKFIIDLDPSVFTTADLRIEVTPTAENGKPTIATYQIVDGLPGSIQVEVYTKKLSTALGVVGNAWTNFATSFHISIHAEPTASVAWGSLEAQWYRASATGGYGLVGGGDQTTPRSWSLGVKEQAELYGALTAEHDSTGEHNTREVAKISGRVYYNGSVYKCDDDPLITSLSRASAGVVTLNYSSLSTPVGVFICSDYGRSNGGTNTQTIVGSTGSTATATTIQAYQWDTTNLWWQVADCDFWVAIHGN